MRASPLPLRSLATALGLVLPLACLPACADPSGWVDPPKASAKPATPAPAPEAKPAAPEKAPAVAEAAKPEAPKAAPRSTHARHSEPREQVAATPRYRSAAPRARLADTPAMGPAPSAPSAPPVAPAARVEAAQALALDYLSAVSAPGEALVGAAPRFYGARVRFYGRPTTLAGLLAEKRDFARRWPERRYAARAFNTRCSPDGATCIVRAIVDFRAVSPARGVASKGASELVLEVSFAGQRPVIVAESGRVLYREGDRAETLARGAGRG
jgi:hypothetical protein